MATAEKIFDFVDSFRKNLPKRPHLNKEEAEVADHIIQVYEAVLDGSYKIFKTEYFTSFEDDTKDLNYSPEDDVCHEMKVYGDVIQVSGEPNMVQFSDGELVPVSKLDEATAFYGSKSGYHNNGSRIRPSLATMTSKFRFIKSENHLQKLREYEEKGSIKCNRANNLSFISKELEKIVRKNLEEGKIMHDSTLRFFISDIINKNKIDIKFTASHDWLNKWKRGLGLSSRKITKFVANVRHKSRDQIEKESKEFVAKVNQEMAPYPLSSVFNADQSGFQLEMHTARTLSFTGIKDVHCVVQNVSSTTHSYTVLPLISADGKLHKKLFVTLKEPKGQFPKKGHYKAPNLHVTCHTSHIMTKDLMKEFFKDIVFDSSMPKDALLIVDSWSSWKDSDAIKSVTPRRNKLKVLMIPPGCTGLVQPCDVGIFGGFKKVVKTITGQAQLTHPKYKMFTRDETLKMISIVWWQLCCPKLEDWVKYAWNAWIRRPTTSPVPESRTTSVSS